MVSGHPSCAVPEGSSRNIQRSHHGARKFPLPSLPPIMYFLGGENLREGSFNHDEQQYGSHLYCPCIPHAHHPPVHGYRPLACHRDVLLNAPSGGGRPDASGRMARAYEATLTEVRAHLRQETGDRQGAPQETEADQRASAVPEPMTRMSTRISAASV
jgi:hypothetical protein